MLLQGWQDDGTYFNDQGEQVKASWMEIDGVKYYFDAEGYSVTGWQDIEGKKYYFNEDGSYGNRSGYGRWYDIPFNRCR